MCICGIYAYVYIHIYVCIYVCVCVYIYIYIYICAVIPHTALLSHSELPQGKFLHRDSPSGTRSLFYSLPHSLPLYPKYLVPTMLRFSPSRKCFHHQQNEQIVSFKAPQWLQTCLWSGLACVFRLTIRKHTVCVSPQLGGKLVHLTCR